MLVKPPSRRLDDPRPGYFLVRVVKGGPLVPASITEEFGQWRAFINGEPQGEPFEDPIRAPKVIFIWHSYREEITRDEYLKRCNLATDPSQPSSEPGKKIDLASEPPLF